MPQGEWDSGLFSCMEDLPGSGMTLCCPCFTTAAIGEKLGHDKNQWCCCAPSAGVMRSIVAERYGIQESCFLVCLRGYICGPCGLCQLSRHVNKVEIPKGPGGPGPAPGQMQMGGYAQPQPYQQAPPPAPAPHHGGGGNAPIVINIGR